MTLLEAVAGVPRSWFGVTDSLISRYVPRLH